jgi:hypothetical protein
MTDSGSEVGSEAATRRINFVLASVFKESRSLISSFLFYRDLFFLGNNKKQLCKTLATFKQFSSNKCSIFFYF